MVNPATNEDDVNAPNPANAKIIPNIQLRIPPNVYFFNFFLSHFLFPL